MRIGVFGRHPVPQPGFMGVMSLFEAKHFAILQNEVELLIPFQSEAELNELLAANHIASLNDLPKFDSHFEIVPVFAGAAVARDRYDAIIYQSYDAGDWTNFHGALRRHCNVLTKNFPKFVPGSANAWHPSVEHQFRAFDVVACALRSDIEELQGNPQFWRRYGHKVAYVPRGADPVLLHPARKSGGPPTIGIDMPARDAGIDAVQHYAEAIRLVRQRIPALRVITLGHALPGIIGECVPLGRFDRIYDRFFNEIWVLLTMNYALSQPHVRASVQAMHPDGWKGRALYELQNVEAQMAGAALFGHPTNLIDELMQPDKTGFYYPDYADAPDIAERLYSIICNYDTIRDNARRWAMSRFSWPDCISLWNDALHAAVSDIRKDRRQHHETTAQKLPRAAGGSAEGGSEINREQRLSAQVPSRREADRLYSAGDFGKAERAYQSLLTTSMVGSGWYLFQLGRIAVRRGRYSEAITHLEGALATANPVVWVHWEMAVALRYLGADAATIARALTQFAQRAPLDLGESHYATLALRAHEAFDARCYHEAGILYDLLATRGWDDGLCRLRQADLRLNGGEPAEAIRILDTIKGEPEHRLWADAVRARAMIALDNHAEAAALLKQTVARAPDNADLVRLLFVALEGDDDREGLAAPYVFLHGLPVEQRFEFLLRARLHCRDLDGVAQLCAHDRARAAVAFGGLVADAMNKANRARDYAVVDRLFEITDPVAQGGSVIVCAMLASLFGRKDWVRAARLQAEAEDLLRRTGNPELRPVVSDGHSD
jgi:tetratricopeptide (TPR) repeat protein